MSWFVNISTRTKLFFSFGLVIALLLTITVTAYLAVRRLQESQRMAVNNYARAVELGELRSDMNRQRSQMLTMMMKTDKGDKEAIERDLRHRAGEIDQSFRDLADLGRDNPGFLRRLDELKAILGEFRTGREAIIRLVVDGKNDEARIAGLGAQEERFEKLRTASEELGAAAQDEARTAVKESERMGDLAVLLCVWAGVLALVVAVVVVAALNRLLASPLKDFAQFVERVGQGDLTRSAPDLPRAADTRDEVGRLGGALNTMVHGLKDVAGQITAATQRLGTASAEIMASVQQQAAGTKEQAATVQEITTTMEQISQSGAQISGRAKQVAAGAEATSVASHSGTRAVQDTTRTMTAIREQVEEVAEHIVALSEKTQAVGEIIATVNDIAERSNLLALNAAIEAAAAGDSGNRFSVVATEMKNLADQAKESTVQVRGILGDIQKGINSSVMLTEEAVKRVEAGKRQADLTEQTIRQMAQSTLDSIQAFEQIIGAGSQQQIGFEQVAQGMKDIRQAATQTATATAQVEAAVANLNALSKELKQVVGRYKL